jgi:hypothetical protein
MPKRKQKKEGISEEKWRAKGTSSSYILLETDLRGRGLPQPDSSLQVRTHRYRLTGIISSVRKNL